MQSLRDVLPAVLRQLQDPEKLKRGTLVDQWESIAGPRIAPHTKPVIGKNKRLIVWVNQSALAYELMQRYQQTLLKRVQAILGEDTIQSISFRVGQLR